MVGSFALTCRLLWSVRRAGGKPVEAAANTADIAMDRVQTVVPAPIAPPALQRLLAAFDAHLPSTRTVVSTGAGGI
jgi:hypothetical protein